METLINIFLNFKNGPWGGGNQFLKALKNQLFKRKAYTNDFKKANIVLFNSHHHIAKILRLKYNNPQKIFIHRIDGPIFFIRNRGKELDNLIFKLSEKIADFTIFQSKWSFEKCRELGFKSNGVEIIYNAPDKKIFNKRDRIQFNTNRKIRIIATSWSKNMNKGFETYQYLDENFNFNRYEFIFVGNSPIHFKNAKHIPPLNSYDLSRELKKADIFITASKNDPCSNSLIEALSCGLPALVLNSGGHPELIGKGGEAFNNNNEILEKLEKLVIKYKEYQENIPSYDIEEVARKYFNIFNNQRSRPPKRINFFEFFQLSIMFYYINVKNHLDYILRKIC